MIVRAVQNGVKVDKIAGALDMEEKDVRGLITLLDGIDAVAANLPRDKSTSPRTLRMLKRVAGSRQFEIAESMVSVNNYAAGYVEGLIWGTPKEQLVNPTAPKEKAGLSVEEVARMEREMESLERAFKAVETNYKENMMTLTVVRGYIRKRRALNSTISLPHAAALPGNATIFAARSFSSRSLTSLTAAGVTANQPCASLSVTSSR
jgi:hypothetical protein